MFEKFSISDIDSAGRGGEYTVQVSLSVVFCDSSIVLIQKANTSIDSTLLLTPIENRDGFDFGDGFDQNGLFVRDAEHDQEEEGWLGWSTC